MIVNRGGDDVLISGLIAVCFFVCYGLQYYGPGLYWIVRRGGRFVFDTNSRLKPVLARPHPFTIL